MVELLELQAMQILSYMCKIENETIAARLSIRRPAQYNYCSRVTPSTQQRT